MLVDDEGIHLHIVSIGAVRHRNRDVAAHHGLVVLSSSLANEAPSATCIERARRKARKEKDKDRERKTAIQKTEREARGRGR